MAQRRKVTKTTREQMRAWLARWEHVAAIECSEQAESTPDDRLRELNSLMQMADDYGFPPAYTEQEIANVRKTWAKIRANSLKEHSRGNRTSRKRP
jgi:hypothetical protein